jgi:hypothetical protein
VTLEEDARRVLESAWVADQGYCVPNPTKYPHLWLWDSCFHSIAWAVLGDPRAIRELEAVFVAQTADGFVPHMRYRDRPSYLRGPREDASSFTQPPIYGIAVEELGRRGLTVPAAVVEGAVAGVRYLASHRSTDDGLVVIWHPWESGADDSPRWDDWVGTTTWTRERYTESDQSLFAAVRYADGVAVGSTAFASCPAAFNAITGHAAACLARVTGRADVHEIATACAAAIDARLWDDAEQLWDDRPVLGGGPAQRIPTLDGVLGALTTTDRSRAMAALDQVLDPQRFAGPFGPRYVPPDHATYDPGSYWRGPAWPQMSYLVWLAARRWDRTDVADTVRTWTRRGVATSGFAEYWHPETGHGLGAIPQTWSTIVTAMG